MQSDNDVSAEDVIEHYGVLGMKWGVTRQEALVKKSNKLLRKADESWTRGVEWKSGRAFRQMYKEMATAMNDTELTRINNNPKYQGVDLNEEGPLRDEYHAEITSTATRLLNEAADRRFGVSPSGKFQVRFNYDIYDDGRPTMGIVPVRPLVKHEDDDFLPLDVSWDNNGQVIAVVFKDDDPIMAQDAINLAMDSFKYDPESAINVLVHYGVLGMKWGVRRDLDRLNDEELKKTIERMKLEKQYREIAQPRAGRAFIAKHGDKVFGSAVTTITAFAVKRYLNNRFGDAGKTTSDAAQEIIDVASRLKA